MPKTLLFCFVFLFCQGCQVGFYNTEIYEITNEQRKKIGMELEKRLLENRGVKPVFSNRQNLELYEVNALVYFTESLPSGTFIFTGNPTYLFVIEKKNLRKGMGFPELKRISYHVQIIDTHSKKIIAESESSSDCNDSDATVTYPVSCSIRAPSLLTEVLRSL